jgi:uncharacterized protein (DUF2126 family)
LVTELVHKLRQQYGQGGFLHFGQGKWYPGEQLPRWALSIYWRADGTPCWQDSAVFADEREPSAYTSADAQRFMQTLTARLGLPGDTVLPGYEDTWYYLWRERRLPVNVDPFDARLDDEMERNRLRRIFSQGLDAAVGYVLPLQPSMGQRARTWCGQARGGKPATGLCATSACTSCPATPPWAGACRSTHCLGPRPPSAGT